jgi:hypothetical protein
MSPFPRELDGRAGKDDMEIRLHSDFDKVRLLLHSEN